MGVKFISLHKEKFMEWALDLAYQAQERGEVPIGAVLVENDTVIGEGYNQPISLCDPTAHAEILALRQAAKTKENYRLPGTVLYTTLEPCTMCISALLHARVESVIFGAYDPKSAAKVLLESPLTIQLNHSLIYEGGVLADRCANLLKNFFKEKR